MPLFSTDLDKEPIQYPYVYDIQVALLRTRYYQAKYMVYRPFVYKVYAQRIHTPRCHNIGVLSAWLEGWIFIIVFPQNIVLSTWDV